MRTGKTVLFVDDELATLQSYREALEAHGYTVFEQFTAIDALHCLERDGIDLVLLDIMMPYYRLTDLLRMGREAVASAPKENVWTGLRFFKEVRQLKPTLPIVIFSALTEGEIRKRAEQMQINLPRNVPCLTKGSTPPEQVIETIRRMLR